MRIVHYLKYLESRLEGGLVIIVHYLKYLETRLGRRIVKKCTLPQVPVDLTMWEDWRELYITSSTWRLNYVGGLGRNIHYLKCMESRLVGGNGKNGTLPQTPGD